MYLGWTAKPDLNFSLSLPLSLHVFKGRIFFSWGCYNSLTYYYHFLVKYVSLHLKALWLCSLTKMKNVVDNSSPIYRSDLGVLYMLIQWLELFSHFQIRGIPMLLFAPSIPNSCCFDQFISLVWVFSTQMLLLEVCVHGNWSSTHFRGKHSHITKTLI